MIAYRRTPPELYHHATAAAPTPNSRLEIKRRKRALLTRRERLAHILTQLANDGLPCPTDVELALALGYAPGGSSGVRRLFHLLEADGIIKINKIKLGSKTITVLKTGKTTARRDAIFGPR